MFIKTSQSLDGRAPGPAAASDARTRDRVLRSICETGPVTAASLAQALGLTPAAVRRHLDALEEVADIATASATPGPRGRGRPARAFIVTQRGHRRLSSRYDDIATSALEFVAEHLGDEAVVQFAQDRLSSLEETYAPVVDAAGPDIEARAYALAQALAADGYAASARPVGVAGPATTGLGLQLCQGHCPMHDVAARFPQFCEAETEMFARLLGVHVQRLATLAGGEHVCTTFVPSSTLGGTSDPDRNHPDERTPR